MNRLGMTLLELVVAIAVTGAAVTAGYGTFATLTDRREAAAESASATLRESAARASLARWLSAARVTTEDREILFRGIDGVTREKHADDDLVFFTTAPTTVSRHGTVVRLYISRDETSAQRGLIAELQEWKGNRIVSVELASAAVGFDATYLSSLFGQRQWLSSWVSTSVLPSGVRLAVTAAGGDSVPPLWRIPMTVSIEGGR